MALFLDIRNKYLRLSEPMLLTVGTYLIFGRELHATRTKTITYSFEWKLNNPSYRELKSARMVPFQEKQMS
jgi:hypothetical protein